MKITVIIPTLKRVNKLKACLQSLELQEELPFEIIITVKFDDTETLDFLNQWSGHSKANIRLIRLDRPGVIYAENQAIKLVLHEKKTDIITFMDDDAIAKPTWIRSIKTFFTNHPEAKALGGPDIIKSEPNSYYDFPVESVGLVRYYGKVIGNHHRRSSGLRLVDTLKGVNMSVKMDVIETLDENLQGIDSSKGNGVFWELDLCLKIKKKGGLIYFNPDLIIDHDSNHSHFIQKSVVSSTSHNLAYVLMKHFSPIRRMLFVFYAVIIGNSHVLGLAKTVMEVIKQRNKTPLIHCYHSLNGFIKGVLLFCRMDSITHE